MTMNKPCSRMSMNESPSLDFKSSDTMSRIRDMKTGRIQQRSNQGKTRSASKMSHHPRPVEPLFDEVSAEVVLDLDMDHLDIILRNVIKHFSDNRSLIKTARNLSYKVGAVKKPVGKRIGGVNLEDIAEVLETALSTLVELPTAVVAYIHTYLGMIHQQENRYDLAIASFVKALWLRRSAHQPVELIAVASYRLGLAYALNGDVVNAKAALKQAIQFYSKAPMPMDHEFVLAAQNHLFELKKQGGADDADTFFKPKPFGIERDAETVTTSDSMTASYSEGRRGSSYRS